MCCSSPSDYLSDDRGNRQRIMVDVDGWPKQFNDQSEHVSHVTV
jgi:hypothetical protein